MRASSTQLAALAKAMAQVYGKNIPDFDRAFSQLYTPFRTLVVDLGRVAGQSAQGDVYESIGGDFIYVDTDQSTLNGALGSVSLELNDKTNSDVAAFTANPGFALNAVFASIKLRYTNQPGKRVVLKYATGYSVIPSFSALTSISNTVNTDDVGATYVTAFSANTNLVANTAGNIWAAATNVAGVRVLSAYMSSQIATGGHRIAMLHKALAPTTTIDGDVSAQGESSTIIGASLFHYLKRDKAINIPAGLRGDFISDVIETGAQRSCLYKVLP